MQTFMVYSESGGVSKTTTAVSLAMSAAQQGLKAVLIDLDPRAAATKWLDVEPAGEGLHVGAILGNADVEGWAQDLAVESGWHKNLRMIPSDRKVSNREADAGVPIDARLKSSLVDLDADVVILDCPNRQGGPITQSALTASDAVVYAATPTSDGVDGFYGAQTTVETFRTYRKQIGAPTPLREAGIVVGSYQDNVTPRAQSASVDELRDTGLLLTPLIPLRTIVQEARTARDWYGNYRKGRAIVEAYQDITRKVLNP
jgi:chromosome partitioning protein